MASLVKSAPVATDARQVPGVVLFGGLVLAPLDRVIRSNSLEAGKISARIYFEDERANLAALWPIDSAKFDKWFWGLDRFAYDVSGSELGAKLYFLDGNLKLPVFCYDRSETGLLSFSVAGTITPSIGSIVVDELGRLVSVVTISELQIARGLDLTTSQLTEGLRHGV